MRASRALCLVVERAQRGQRHEEPDVAWKQPPVLQIAAHERADDRIHLLEAGRSRGRLDESVVRRVALADQRGDERLLRGGAVRDVARAEGEVPRDLPHPSRDRLLRFRGMHTPGNPGFEVALQVLFGLARDGEVRAGGFPSASGTSRSSSSGTRGCPPERSGFSRR